MVVDILLNNMLYINYQIKEVNGMIYNLIATSSSAPTLDLEFDASQMFQYTNTITSSLMPVVYISAGFALGFTIIYMLKNAFNGRL